jgi:hypothetical protein
VSWLIVNGASKNPEKQARDSLHCRANEKTPPELPSGVFV